MLAVTDKRDGHCVCTCSLVDRSNTSPVITLLQQCTNVSRWQSFQEPVRLSKTTRKIADWLNKHLETTAATARGTWARKKDEMNSVNLYLGK